MTYYSSSPSTRPKSLMELLLAKKIEAASAQGSILSAGGGPSKLFRCDSMDSMSSIGSLGSLILGDDVCRCDDCLLGIVDLWIAGPQEKALLKKKVNFIIDQNSAIAKALHFDWSSICYNKNNDKY